MEREVPSVRSRALAPDPLPLAGLPATGHRVEHLPARRGAGTHATMRVLLADDHVVVREGLKTFLEHKGLQVVGEASDGREAVALAEKLHPDVAVVDLAMPNLNGIDAARETLRVSPGSSVILLTMYPEDHYVLEALRAGVTGYVLKTHAAAELIQAIRKVYQGGFYFSPGVSHEVIESFFSRNAPPAEPITPRQRQVVQLIAEGKTTKEVASVLGISVKTAIAHRTSVMKKLAVPNTAGLVRYAIRRGLIQP